MAISFQCPRGHKLSCADERAGLRGKCPKCGEIFQVPKLVEPAAATAATTEGDSFLQSLSGGTELTSSESGTAIGKRTDHFEDYTGGSRQNEPAAPDSPADEAPAEQDRPAKPPREESIMFLCPSGHKLNAPKSLQGKPGKCPHCGEKFLVPVLEDEVEIEDDDNFLASQSGTNPPLQEFVGPAEPPPAETSSTGSGFFSGLSHDDQFAVGLAEDSSQAMSLLFSRLWADRGDTGVLELYLKGGEILTPRWYAPQLSQSTYGMFAFVEGDGSHTLTAVQWDAIERIALRGMPNLPEGVFEE